jgi:hypothetical protein
MAGTPVQPGVGVVTANILPLGLTLSGGDDTSEPDCLESLNDANLCEEDDANARCRAMSENATCVENTSGWSHFNDGDKHTPGWGPDGCFCAWA